MCAQARVLNYQSFYFYMPKALTLAFPPTQNVNGVFLRMPPKNFYEI